MKKKLFYLMSDVDSAIGNFSEIIFYTLLKAQRTKKSFVLVRKYIFLRSILQKKLGFRQPRALYKIITDYSHNTNSSWGKLLALYGGGHVFLSYAYEAIKYKSIKSLNTLVGKTILTCDFHPFVPAIGSKDLFNFSQKKYFSFTEDDKLYWQNALSSRFNIELDQRSQKIAQKSFVELGLDKYPWYVCLHVRTPFFYNSTHDLFRNSNIENYYDAIKYITGLGGAVVRMGDPMEKIENIQGLINYPNTQEKSEEMDLYLIQNCRFYIGTNSGIYDTAMLFGVPVLCVNTNDYLFLKPYKICDTFIYKHVYSKTKQKVLTFKELFNEPFLINSNIMLNADLQKFHDLYELIENSQEEILMAVKNFIENLDNDTYKQTEAQIRFKSYMDEAIMKWIETEKYFKDDIDQAYRVFSKLQFNGSIDKSFAEKYFE